MERPDQKSIDLNAVTSSLMPTVPVDDLNLTRTLGADTTQVVSTGAPSSLPNYDIQNELGRGGMGVVYKARQIGLNREVALKMVIAGAHASATERVRFLAEAEAIALVQHSGIIQVFDFGTHQGLPFFAMEYCPGGTLAAKLNNTPIPATEAAKIVIKIALAMQAAHDKGIVHRDLKPSNILFSHDNEPKVTDFGLARTGESGSGLTQTGAILGSPSYMSPEQAEGKHSLIGPTSDVYSIGAILYECLTGRPPFRAATPLDTVMLVIKDDPVPPSKLAAKIPRDLETICLKTLSKDISKRYQTAAALADDLNRFLTGEPILARPPGIVEKYVKSFKKRPLVHVLGIITTASIGVVIGVLNASNQNLREKQALLEKATSLALEATKDSEAQKVRATRRLEQAVEAVEKVMVRVAGEKWALRPELQKERREVLEEALEFFKTLGAEESQDPIVRLQTGRANLFAAASYISLADYDNCLLAITDAHTQYQGLVNEFPNDSRYHRGLAESEALKGHVHAIRAEFNLALTQYESALAMATECVKREPDNDDNKHLKADTLSSLALFYSFQRPDLSLKYHQQALAIGEELLTLPSPKYRARLIVMNSLANIGISEMGKNLPEAKQKLDRAQQQSDIIDKLTPPNARSAESAICTRAGIMVYRGLICVREKKMDEGIEAMKSGVALLDSMIAIQPNSFPFRIQRIQFLGQYADALLTAGKTDSAQKAIATMKDDQDHLVRMQPNLTWIRGLGHLQQTLYLIHTVRESFSPDFEVEADRLLELSSQVRETSAKYNIACTYAQAVKYGPENLREKYFTRAIELLEQVLDKTSYFHDPQTVKHFIDDTDFDPIRNRPEFQAFTKKVSEALPQKSNSIPGEKSVPSDKK